MMEADHSRASADIAPIAAGTTTANTAVANSSNNSSNNNNSTNNNSSNNNSSNNSVDQPTRRRNRHHRGHNNNIANDANNNDAVPVAATTSDQPSRRRRRGKNNHNYSNSNNGNDNDNDDDAVPATNNNHNGNGKQHSPPQSQQPPSQHQQQQQRQRRQQQQQHQSMVPQISRHVTFPRDVVNSIDAEQQDELMARHKKVLDTANKEKMAGLVREMLVCLGEDPEREGLVKTPERVTQALIFFTQGYTRNLSVLLNDAVFEEATDEMVIVRNIDIYSLCEHHMVPFTGKCHIGYIANNRVVGLSKLARIADMFSQRLQVQERLTKQIANAVNTALDPQGVAVVIEAVHMCMVMRGVQKAGTSTVTSCMLGVFRDDPRTREEFLKLIKGF